MTPNPNPSPELKPCPFCGGDERNLSNAGNECHYTVVCEACDAEGPWIGFDPKVEGSFTAAVTEAHTAWNTRALSPQTLPAPGEEWTRTKAFDEAAAECLRAAKESKFADTVSEDERKGYRTACNLMSMSFRVMASRAAPDWAPPATVPAANDEGVAIAIEALEPFARVHPHKNEAGASAILIPVTVADVRRAAAAIRLLPQGGGK